MTKEFMKITNKDIYDRIIMLDYKINKINTATKINRWIATTALSITLLIVGLLIGEII